MAATQHITHFTFAKTAAATSPRKLSHFFHLDVAVWCCGMQQDHHSSQRGNVILQSGLYMSVRACVRVCVCVCVPQRNGASRSSGQWLTMLLSIADEGAVSLLCQYKQTSISLTRWTSHTHTRTHTHSQGSTATTVNLAGQSVILCCILLCTVNQAAVRLSQRHVLSLRSTYVFVTAFNSPPASSSARRVYTISLWLWGDQFGRMCPEATASNQYLGICQHSPDRLLSVPLPPFCIRWLKPHPVPVSCRCIFRDTP